MELDAVLLADYAVIAEGKLFIQGGGVTEVRAPTFPWIHPQLALVVRLRLEDGEEWTARTLNFRLLAPDASFAVPPTDLAVPEAPAPLSPEGDRFVQVALTVAPIPFLTQGLYRLELALDGEPLRTLRLNVTPAEGAG